MMDRLRAAFWSFGVVHRARHQDADQVREGLDERDRDNQEAMKHQRRELEAMSRRLRIIEQREEIVRRRHGA